MKRLFFFRGILYNISMKEINAKEIEDLVYGLALKAGTTLTGGCVRALDRAKRDENGNIVATYEYDAFSEWEIDPANEELRKKYFTGDEIHPNDNGHRYIAERLAESFGKLK